MSLSPSLILIVIMTYFLVLIIISFITGRSSTREDFYIGGKNSPWLLVAVGMIGASLSGVTFISIPGVVGKSGINQSFSYMQMVMGYLVGYVIIARVLMPVYYKMNLTSIYGYLEERFGAYSYKIGAGYFLLSRTIGASFRLYLVAIVLDAFVLGPMGFEFWHTVAMTILLIWVYTFKGGIKTIVWTDTLQTVSMLVAVILTIFSIAEALNVGLFSIPSLIAEHGYGQWFFFEAGWADPNNFIKQFSSGVLIALVMTGLDQDMMQKNLSCRNLKEAQKNMYTFSVVLFFVNILFLSLGALLYIYAGSIGVEIPDKTDQLFPMLALNHLPGIIGLSFIVGLIAAAYSSADSALTALTTSFSVDILELERDELKTRKQKDQMSIRIHIGFSILLFLTILLFDVINNEAVINNLFEWAGYTYGPLLGLFSFGLLTHRKVLDKRVLPVVLLAPVLSYFINVFSEELFWGFQFGFLIVALNGLLTFVGLWMISSPQIHTKHIEV